MEELSNVYAGPLPPDSPYVQPFRLHYTQSGCEKNWDLLRVHDSVAVIIFNISRRVMVFVKQFRPAVYIASIPPKGQNQTPIDVEKYPARLGITLEICAGIVDKQKHLDEIAVEEVMEECGYEIDRSLLQKVSSYRAGVGVSGAIQTLYYCEVTDAMKKKQGGGVGDEIIEVVELSVCQLEQMLVHPGPHASPPSAMFAIMWFLHYKADKYRRSFNNYCQECKKREEDKAVFKIQKE